MLLAISLLLLKVTDFKAVTQAVDTHIGPSAFNPFDKQSFGLIFAFVFFSGGFIQRLAFPPALQKMSSAKSPKVVRRMYLLSIIFGQGRMMLFVLWGIAALALFGPEITTGYDPEVYGRVLGGRLIRTLTEGIPLIKGLALSAFLFASISTNDSYLLSWSSVIVNDCVYPLKQQTLPRKQHIRLLQIASLGIAVSIFLFGCWYTPKETILQFFYLTGAVFGACGLITWFGLYWKRATPAGAWTCLGLGLVLPVTWFIFQKYSGDVLSQPANAHLKEWVNAKTAAFVATVIPIIGMVVVSLLTSNKLRFVDYGAKLRDIKAREKAMHESKAE